MPSARPLDFDFSGPFLGSEALAAGLSPSSLKSRKFRRILRGVYIVASIPVHPLHRVQAALLIHPPLAFASHTSAATVYRLPVPFHAHEHVTVPTDADRRRRPEVRTHVAAAADIGTYRGLRVSSPTRLFIELAGLLSLVDLVVVGDSLVRDGLTSPEELRDTCAASSDKHAVAARRAAALVRAEVDSPMESRLRMLLVLAGLPEPLINVKVYDEHGRVRYRFDLCYPDVKVVVEYDGRQHRADLDQWDHDTERRDWLDDEGWRLVSVFSHGIYKHPDETINRVRTALRSRGVKLPKLADDWHPYFPMVPR